MFVLIGCQTLCLSSRRLLIGQFLGSGANGGGSSFLKRIQSSGLNNHPIPPKDMEAVVEGLNFS